MVTAAALWCQKAQNMPGTQTQSWKHQPKAQALSTEEHKHLHADCRVQAGGLTVMHHMTTEGDKANQPLSLSLELPVANHRRLLCSSPSATDTPLPLPKPCLPSTPALSAGQHLFCEGLDSRGPPQFSQGFQGKGHTGGLKHTPGTQPCKKN